MMDMKEDCRSHYVKDLRNLLDESPLTERKSFIKSFIKEARVTGAEVSLIYTIPMSPRGITNDELAVLPFVRNGGTAVIRTNLPPHNPSFLLLPNLEGTSRQ
jgi:hypothetical protein